MQYGSVQIKLAKYLRSPTQSCLKSYKLQGCMKRSRLKKGLETAVGEDLTSTVKALKKKLER